MKLDYTMVPVPYDLLLMLQRRGAISFEKGDKTALYVRQLGKGKSAAFDLCYQLLCLLITWTICHTNNSIVGF